MTKPTSEVKNRWNAKTYDRIMFVVRKESALKSRIKDRAAALGMSANAYLTMLVEKDLDDCANAPTRQFRTDLPPFYGPGAMLVY